MGAIVTRIYCLSSGDDNDREPYGKGSTRRIGVISEPIRSRSQLLRHDKYHFTSED
ncbi:ORF132 [Leucania separata nucleopolyhedrovirus]|uniref:ORF132 n=1 Tax=Leucania separata nucleopolyhedrovirus TaxID=1307956 RepID=Q0IKY7_NPVLS|nr:ORF132 [Leucania separata nucleopolyhedrovirus]AAR28896.1 ORF132 [Leucania separata nucleopolyhedrovirus]